MMLDVAASGEGALPQNQSELLDQAILRLVAEHDAARRRELTGQALHVGRRAVISKRVAAAVVLAGKAAIDSARRAACPGRRECRPRGMKRSGRARRRASARERFLLQRRLQRRQRRDQPGPRRDRRQRDRRRLQQRRPRQPRPRRGRLPAPARLRRRDPRDQRGPRRRPGQRRRRGLQGRQHPISRADVDDRLGE